ncbi:cRISPR-associated endoribonuclease Cas2 2 [Butyrivibrio sp. CAG:318]|nr:cRISPR-associated endoribonuclease Cas2 2 [Butyrivibrio sp. CAG:318]
MSYRFMRILVMFDLPTVTSADRREYALFRKYLIKSGFMMMQESIYCKLSPNSTLADAAIENVRKNKPSKGLVQILRVTEKQFAKMDYIVGEGNTEVLSSDDRLVIL